ncbi:hypothetical protein [Tunturiibacter gelidiferens]|uniref:hypothetical protein n=1 Tax=Tunturiibacter gelidiferens TaxID=3069689 RepID=UPI003D9B6C10
MQGRASFFSFGEDFLAFALTDGDFFALTVSFFGTDFFFAADFFRVGAAAAARARDLPVRTGAGGLIATTFFATGLGRGRERR